MAAGDRYQSSGMIVTNQNGGFIELRTFKDYYNQILSLAGLQHFTFHALRHTFASRAMAQGMDAKTRSVILGHYSVAFTMDTYAHVMTDHKKENMALMVDLYSMGQGPMMSQEAPYPVIATPQEDGSFLMAVYDYPNAKGSVSDNQEENEMLQDEKRYEGTVDAARETASGLLDLEGGILIAAITAEMLQNLMKSGNIAGAMLIVRKLMEAVEVMPPEWPGPDDGEAEAWIGIWAETLGDALGDTEA